MSTSGDVRRPGFHYGWVILLQGMLAVFASLGLARFGYTTVLPAMQAGLGMDNAQAGKLATANLAGYLAMALIGGALAARFGPRKVISAALAVAGIALVMTGFADTPGEAAVWRAVAGLGSGASNVPVMGLMAAWFARRRRGLATGVAVAGSSVAIILIGPLVPKILEAAGADGWRVCWHIFGLASLVLAAASWLVLRDRPEDLGLRPMGGDEGAPVAAIKAGGLHWGSVYTSGVVWHLGLVYVAFGFSYIIYMTFFVKHLRAEGYSKEAAGTLFMVLGWSSLFCGLIWGAVSDRIGRKGALIIVYMIQAAAFLLFAVWREPAGYILSTILFGLTAWSIPAVMAAACGDLLGPRLASAGVGFITLFFGIGQAAAPTIAGAMADRANSFSPAFLLATAVAICGAIGAAALPKGHKGD